MEFKYSSKWAIRGGVIALVLDARAYPPSPAQPQNLSIAHNWLHPAVEWKANG